MEHPSNFHARLSEHGKAEGMVRKQLAVYHVMVAETGFQINDSAHHFLNQEWTRHDPVSEFLRHLPDFVTIPMCGRCALVDIKSKSGAKPFSVECDSLHAALQLEWLGYPTYFAFVNIPTGAIEWLAAGNVPCNNVRLPNEFDRVRMAAKFPGAAVNHVGKCNGSGTPYVWVNTPTPHCLTTRQFVETFGVVIDEHFGEALA